MKEIKIVGEDADIIARMAAKLNMIKRECDKRMMEVSNACADVYNAELEKVLKYVHTQAKMEYNRNNKFKIDHDDKTGEVTLTLLTPRDLEEVQAADATNNIAHAINLARGMGAAVEIFDENGQPVKTPTIN